MDIHFDLEPPNRRGNVGREECASMGQACPYPKGAEPQHSVPPVLWDLRTPTR